MKLVEGKILSIYKKKTATGYNCQCIHGQFELGGASTEVANISMRSITVATDESDNVEEAYMAMAEVQVPTDPTVNGETTKSTEEDAITVTLSQSCWF